MPLKLLMFFSLVIILAGCSHISGSQAHNHVTSSEIKTSQERIGKLKKYFTPKTDILDTEFDIFDVNIDATRSIPGATSKDFKIVLLVDPINMDSWTIDTKISSSTVDYQWISDLIKNNSNFKPVSKPLLFTGVGREVIIFKVEGIIGIRIRHD